MKPNWQIQFVESSGKARDVPNAANKDKDIEIARNRMGSDEQVTKKKGKLPKRVLNELEPGNSSSVAGLQNFGRRGQLAQAGLPSDGDENLPDTHSESRGTDMTRRRINETVQDYTGVGDDLGMVKMGNRTSVLGASQKNTGSQQETFSGGDGFEENKGTEASDGIQDAVNGMTTKLGENEKQKNKGGQWETLDGGDQGFNTPSTPEPDDGIQDNYNGMAGDLGENEKQKNKGGGVGEPFKGSKNTMGGSANEGWSRDGMASLMEGGAPNVQALFDKYANSSEFVCHGDFQVLFNAYGGGPIAESNFMALLANNRELMFHESGDAQGAFWVPEPISEMGMGTGAVASGVGNALGNAGALGQGQELDEYAADPDPDFDMIGREPGPRGRGPAGPGPGGRGGGRGGRGLPMGPDRDLGPMGPDPLGGPGLGDELGGDEMQQEIAPALGAMAGRAAGGAALGAASDMMGGDAEMDEMGMGDMASDFGDSLPEPEVGSGSFDIGDGGGMDEMGMDEMGMGEAGPEAEPGGRRGHEDWMDMIPDNGGPEDPGMEDPYAVDECGMGEMAEPGEASMGPSYGQDRRYQESRRRGGRRRTLRETHDQGMTGGNDGDSVATSMPADKTRSLGPNKNTVHGQQTHESKTGDTDDGITDEVNGMNNDLGENDKQKNKGGSWEELEGGAGTMKENVMRLSRVAKKAIAEAAQNIRRKGKYGVFFITHCEGIKARKRGHLTEALVDVEELMQAYGRDSVRLEARFFQPKGKVIGKTSLPLANIKQRGPLVSEKKVIFRFDEVANDFADQVVAEGAVCRVGRHNWGAAVAGKFNWPVACDAFQNIPSNLVSESRRPFVPSR